MKTRWINPGLGRHKRLRLPKPPTFTAFSKDTVEGADGDEEVEQEDDPEVPGSPENATTTAAPDEQEEQEDTSRATQVQILDLDTSNPIVSYDGHVFSCQWVRNIGTELIFIAHDKNNPLPHLRTLPGNVDLLAASSARLISNSIKVEPKGRESPPPIRHGRNRLISNLAIPVGNAASAKRIEQARFLERVIALKEDKGESDLVTVFAKARNTPAKWREQIRLQMHAERTRLKDIVKKGPKDIQEVVDATKRLVEMDREDEKRASLPKSVKRTTGPKAKDDAFHGKKAATRLASRRSMKRKEPPEDYDDEYDNSDFATPDAEWEGMLGETPHRHGLEYQDEDEELYD